MNLLKNTLTAVATLLCVQAYGAPLIGINVDVSGDSVTDARLGVSSTYVDAVTSAGGVPVLIPPALDESAISRYVELCDGFVMTGGRDISPSRYGSETTHPTTNLLNPRREDFDFALIDAILAADKPVLGVCLGLQELNVALGGSMIQDLPTETSSTIAHKPGDRHFAHEVHITTGTRLQDIAGTTTLQVNSIHHQACDRLGSGVLVMAKAPDGVVESFEVENKNFAVGVQWHPEVLTTATEHLAVYEALVKAAERSSSAPQD